MVGPLVAHRRSTDAKAPEHAAVKPSAVGLGVACLYCPLRRPRARRRRFGLAGGESSSDVGSDGGVGGGEHGGESGGSRTSIHRTVILISNFRVRLVKWNCASSSAGSGTTSILRSGISSALVVRAVT